MLKQKVQIAVTEALKSLNLEGWLVNVEQAAQEKHGDYATSAALGLAKKLKQPPLKVAEQIMRALPKIEGVAKVKVAPPGFINFFLDSKWLAREILGQVGDKASPYWRCDLGRGQKVIVEHTSVNPNKAMHVGNLRSAIIGDSAARLLKKCGYAVEVENYIDDTGAQVADTTLAVKHLKREPPAGQPFDEFCWDLYAEINRLYEQDLKLQAERRKVMQAIEQGGNETAKLADEIALKITQCHLALMVKFDIFYDLLVFESDVIKTGLWETTFELLKLNQKFVYEKTGPNEGCWVLKYEGSGGDKVFVRRDGTKVYTAKDTAFHLWKFGLLPKDFWYQKWPQVAGEKVVWRTASYGESQKFGQAKMIVNIIDERQSYPQQMVKLALEVLGFADAAKNFRHLAYGVVQLSPATAKALGVDTSVGKATYAMAGRKGIGVKVSDLVKLLIKKISAEKKSAAEVSEAVAMGAIRHYLLKYHPSSPVVFDYEQALALQGNTGPYLQYSHTRAAGILRKARSFAGALEKGEPLTPTEEKLVKLLAAWPEVIKDTAKTLTLSNIAEYAFKLSAAFHAFYEANPVLKSAGAVKSFRLALVAAYQKVIADVLDLLGIKPLEKM